MSVKLSTEEFIERAKKVHGEKYSYEKIKYKNARTKVTITCREHGDFLQNPNHHLNGHNCYKCKGDVIIDQNQFIEKAKEIHGNKYDYSKACYINKNTKVTIICPEHGEFRQTSRYHLKGKRCQKCGIIKEHNKTKLTIEQFITKAILIHGDKYNYDKTKYYGGKNKIIIVCKKHGEFRQIPESHLQNKGCPNCNISYGEKSIRKYLEQNNINFIQEKTFPDLRGVGGGLLRFDFFLPEYNTCVEFDGRQHFDKRYCEEYFGNYKDIKLHDYKKSKYCRKQGIKLIRIPYHQNYKNKILEILDLNLLIKKAA
jgi:hypothetical protein